MQGCRLEISAAPKKVCNESELINVCGIKTRSQVSLGLLRAMHLLFVFHFYDNIILKICRNLLPKKTGQVGITDKLETLANSV